MAYFVGFCSSFILGLCGMTSFGDLTLFSLRADEASDRSFCFQSLLEKSKSESTLSDLFNKVVTTAFASVIICATYLREFATYLREIFATYRVLGVSRIVGNYYKYKD